MMDVKIQITCILIFHLILLSDCHQTIESIEDVEGNKYRTERIGSQIWMIENLKTTHYLDGSPIINASDPTTWNKITVGAYCNYNCDPTHKKKYGLLYNWYTTNDHRKLCPAGWHVPDESDWNELENFLGGSQYAGGKMKEPGRKYWEKPNLGATNESNFSALASGFRHQKGGFFLFGKNACFWSATQSTVETAWYRDLDSNDQILGKLTNFKNSGLSVRCIKD